MTSALATMRVDYDQVKIKDLDTSSNPLLNKRRKKAAAGAKSGSTVCQSQWDTEDYWWENCQRWRQAAQKSEEKLICAGGGHLETCIKEMFSEIKRGNTGTTAKSETDIYREYLEITSPVSPFSGRNQQLCSLWALPVFKLFLCLYVTF